MIKVLTSFRTPASWLLFLTLVGLVHIAAVIWMASTSTNALIARAVSRPPVNTFRIQPPLNPTNQPLPFIMPEGHYAICAFDLTDVPLRLSAYLPDAGWTFSLHAEDGSGYYYAPGSSDEARTIVMDLMPPGEELNALEMAASPQDLQIAKITSPSFRGLAVIKAPVIGLAYTANAIEQLQRSICEPIGRGRSRASAQPPEVEALRAIR